MTIFGWDASHYDGDLTKDVLVRARDEGIEFFTHKIGEGLSNTDDTAAGALTAARDAGIEVVGAYYFVHSGDVVAQALRCVALADQLVPWWRDFPGWFWQTDAETDTAGHLPSPAEVKLFSDTLAAHTSRRVVVYASHGMYGDRLTGLGHLLWNANYPSSRRDGFKALYPGDGYAGWTPYSGQTPALCQYTSKATIAGRTTCDANAFRGTIDELLTLIGAPDMALTDAEKADLVHDIWYTKNLPSDTPTETPATALLQAQQKAVAAAAQSAANGSSLSTLNAKVDAQGAKLDQVLALLQGSVAPTGGGTVALDDATVAEIAVATADELHDRLAG